MSKKESIIFYFDWIDAFSDLPGEQVKEILQAIVCFVRDGNETDFPDVAQRIIYQLIKRQVERDIKKYERICDKRAEYGRNGGLAKASKSKQVLAKLADNDNDNDTDTENDTENDNENDNDNTEYTEATVPNEYTAGAVPLPDVVKYFFARYEDYTGREHAHLSKTELSKISQKLRLYGFDRECVDVYFGDSRHKGLCGESDCSIWHFTDKTVMGLIDMRRTGTYSAI